MEENVTETSDYMQLKELMCLHVGVYVVVSVTLGLSVCMSVCLRVCLL